MTRYMDFIPARPKTPAPKKPTISVSQKSIIKAKPESIIKETEFKVTKSESFSIPKKTITPPVPPQAHFIKTNVAKRPLSPNVYPKNETKESSSEKLQEPVAIIDNPKKESRVGLIITIILVIILGAAAGTIAFFLIPR